MASPISESREEESDDGNGERNIIKCSRRLAHPLHTYKLDTLCLRCQDEEVQRERERRERLEGFESGGILYPAGAKKDVGGVRKTREERILRVGWNPEGKRGSRTRNDYVSWKSGRLEGEGKRDEGSEERMSVATTKYESGGLGALAVFGERFWL